MADSEMGTVHATDSDEYEAEPEINERHRAKHLTGWRIVLLGLWLALTAVAAAALFTMPAIQWNPLPGLRQ